MSLLDTAIDTLAQEVAALQRFLTPLGRDGLNTPEFYILQAKSLALSFLRSTGTRVVDMPGYTNSYRVLCRNNLAGLAPDPDDPATVVLNDAIAASAPAVPGA